MSEQQIRISIYVYSIIWINNQSNSSRVNSRDVVRLTCSICRYMPLFYTRRICNQYKHVTSVKAAFYP